MKTVVVPIEMTGPMHRAWQERAKRNRRTLEDEVAFTLESVIQADHSQVAHGTGSAKAPTIRSNRAKSLGVVDEIDHRRLAQEIQDWMRSAGNRSGFVGVYPNGTRWQARMPDPDTGGERIVSGFPTALEAAIARQRFILKTSARIPKRGRKTKRTESREERIEKAMREMGCDRERAERAVDTMDSLLQNSVSVSWDGPQGSDH